MDVFECASATLAACQAVLRRLAPDDLGRPSPCREYTAGEVGQHIARSMVLLASVAGEQIASPDAGLAEQVTATAEAALAAWRKRGLDGSVAVGRSVLPASLAAEIIPLELLVHGWDVARATARELEVPPEIADHVLGCARELVTEDKRGRSFASEVPPRPEATVLEQLIAFTGRVP